ncbi:MAG TPA: ribosomal protein S18-alanine N-acetyltransferase [Candidatus Hydrogenedens sp.]|nr:ribosomal protein S18-alanine N-acetyltransferase [Candidatus Hydrogenedens sp.]
MSKPLNIIIGPENTKVNVFLLQKEHIDRVYELELASYPDAWAKELFFPEIGDKGGNFFVFFINDELMGYAGYWIGFEEAHITKFTVAPEYRRKGFGTLFMNFIFEQARKKNVQKIVLEVREKNYAARRLYEKMGFQTIGTRYGYYSKTRENAVVMIRYLHNLPE